MGILGHTHMIPDIARTHMNSLKKRTACFLLLLFALHGCASSGLENQKSVIFNQDDQYWFVKPTSSSISMAKSEEGYYFFSGPQNHYLYYMDKDTLKPAIVCNKPDCLHADEPHPEKIPECNAFFLSNNSNLIYSNSSLYVFGSEAGDYDHMNIYRISLDGTQHQKVYTFLEYPSYITIHRGYLYYVTNDNGTVADREDSTTSCVQLFRITLGNLKKAPELLYELNGIYANIAEIKGYQASVFFLSNAYQDSSLKSVTATLQKFELSNGEVNTICSNAGHYSICGSKIVYYWIDGNVYSCNMDGSGKKMLDHVRGYTMSDEKLIYTDTIHLKRDSKSAGSSGKRQLLIYDLEGSLLRSIDIDDLGTNSMYGGDGEYFFLPDDRSNRNEFGTISSLWIINKDDLVNRSANFEKIFEFVPKIEFKGVVLPNN